MSGEGRGAVRWDHVAAAILLAAMAVISFVNVLGRYFFHYSLAFTEEVTIHLFVWLTVVGSGIAFERGGHLGMVSVRKVLPARVRAAVAIVGAVLSAGLFVAVDLLLVRTIHQEITLFHATSPALGIPVWVYQAGVILFSPAVFMGVYRGARRELRACRQGE